MTTSEPEQTAPLTRREARERAARSGSSAFEGSSASAGVASEAVASGDAAEPAAIAEAEADTAAPAAPADPERPRRGPKWLAGLIVKIVSWAVLVGATILIVGFVLVPRLTGSTPYTVLTGSMIPSMPPGTTVVVKPIPFDEIQVGDVITYQLSSGEPEVVTHRVVGIDVTEDGLRLETKGDNNATSDPSLVRAEQVRGKVWYWLPVVGYFSSSITNDARGGIAKVLGIGLLGYAVVSVVVLAVRAPKRAQKRARDRALRDENAATPEQP